ncbi:hypothetical protein Tco_1383554 [Tanacetum coccineum]
MKSSIPMGAPALREMPGSKIVSSLPWQDKGEASGGLFFATRMNASPQVMHVHGINETSKLHTHPTLLCKLLPQLAILPSILICISQKVQFYQRQCLSHLVMVHRWVPDATPYTVIEVS